VVEETLEQLAGELCALNVDIVDEFDVDEFDERRQEVVTDGR